MQQFVLPLLLELDDDVFETHTFLSVSQPYKFNETRFTY